jgi:hypothetical protein
MRGIRGAIENAGFDSWRDDFYRRRDQATPP